MDAAELLSRCVKFGVTFELLAPSINPFCMRLSDAQVLELATIGPDAFWKRALQLSDDDWTAYMDCYESGARCTGRNRKGDPCGNLVGDRQSPYDLQLSGVKAGVGDRCHHHREGHGNSSD